MAELGEISIAIDQIEIKKENLRQSFLHLQSQQSPSSSPLNSTLNWTEIDSYFKTLTTPILHKFHLLKTLIPPPPPPPSSTVQSQLNSFCRNSDGLGLRSFITDSKNRNSISALLPAAYRCSPDPAAMVLDAMAGFFGGKGLEGRLVKNGCLIMLEGLMIVKPDVRVRVRVEVRDKAMKIAVELNLLRMNSYGKEKNIYTLGFLHLVDAYGLIDEFTMDEIMDCFVYVAKRPDGVALCRRMFPANKITDLIQELIKKNNHVAAVKFVIEFKKTDEFSSVDLLEERKLMSMRIVEITPKTGKKPENTIISNEIFTLRSIIRCIDTYHLGSKYPKHEIAALVKKLENEAGCRKRPAIEQHQQQSKSKKAKVNNFLEAADESDENIEQPD